MFLKCLNNRVDNWWHLKRELHIEGVSHQARQTGYDEFVKYTGLNFLVLSPFFIRLNAHDSEFQSYYLLALMGKILLSTLKTAKGERG